MVGHIRKNRPRHHLQKIPIERKRQAVGRRARTGTAGVNVIEVRAVPHHVQEVRKCVTSLRPTRFIRRQVARIEVNNATRATRERTKIVPSCEIVRRVHCRLSVERWRKQIRVSRRRKFDSRIEGVTPVAIRLRVTTRYSHWNVRRRRPKPGGGEVLGVDDAIRVQLGSDRAEPTSRKW
jgi:hypothetical protein